jgi:prepilin-type N-terminal cleavage/methylation domain-containing protein
MRRELGFSLLELLMTLVLLGILYGFSFIDLSFLQRKNQLDAKADELKQIIHFAKIEALATSKTLTLAAISPDEGWSMGARLFVDNPAHQYTQGTTLIREFRWSPRGVTIQWNGFESKQYLRFSPVLHEGSLNGKFILQDFKKNTIQLVINRLGRVRVS